MLSQETNNPQNVELRKALCVWIEELPLLLIQLGDKHPTCSLVIMICNFNSSSLCKIPESGVLSGDQCASTFMILKFYISVFNIFNVHLGVSKASTSYWTTCFVELSTCLRVRQHAKLFARFLFYVSWR